MTERREGDDVVRITTREIYDLVLALGELGRDTSGKIDNVLTVLASQGVKVDKLESRVLALELAAPAAVGLANTVSHHDGQLQELRSRVDRSSWIPALVAGLIPTVAGGLILYSLTTGFTL